MRPKPFYHPGEKIGGRYLVHQASAEDICETYQCLDLSHNHPRVLQTIQPPYLRRSPALADACFIEAGNWIALRDHPNLVRCYRAEVLDDKPFLVLDWVAGQTMRVLCAEGPLATDLVISLMIDVCRALTYADQRQPGTTHGDLRPENILVTPAHIARLNGYGLVRAVLDGELNHYQSGDDLKPIKPGTFMASGSTVGAPHYLAPEIWAGQQSDPRTDVYALGCILYETIVGKPPFAAGPAWGLRRQHRDGQIPPLPERSDIPPRLAQLIGKCLSKQPEERPQGAGALLAALSELHEQQYGTPARGEIAGTLAQVAESCNRGAAYWELGRSSEALTDLAQAIQLTSGKRQLPASLHQGVRTLSQQGQPRNGHSGVEDEAERLLTAYRKMMEDVGRQAQIDGNGHFFYQLGVLQAWLQDYDHALRSLDQAISRQPDHGAAHALRGKVRARLGLHAEALADMGQATRMDAAGPDLYRYQGALLLRLGRYDQAQASLAQALALEPDNPEAHFHHAVGVSGIAVR